MSTVTVTVQEVISTPTASGTIMYRIKGSDNVNYGCGATAPPCKQGDTVTFEVVHNGNYKNAKKGTIRVTNDTPPTQVASPAPSGGSSFKNANFREPDSIIYQESLGQAIDVVKFAIEQGALKLPTKANLKYDALNSIVGELANTFAWQAKHPKIIDPELYAMEQLEKQSSMEGDNSTTTEEA